ncbi:MAG: ATP-binding protein [Bacteroidota bacterium]
MFFSLLMSIFVHYNRTPLFATNEHSMLLKSEIEKAVTQQALLYQKKVEGIERGVLPKIRLGKTHILVITGVRRCGKSTLMLQLSRKEKKNFSIFNFEDPRVFNFDTDDFSKLTEVLDASDTLFLDEIQNVTGWEVFVRHLHDLKKVICITGSNASLLSSELSTRLTGRNLQLELFPFSFAEYCRFTGANRDGVSFQDYLHRGGFPDYLSTDNKEVPQQLFKDIIYRDIIVRHGVRNHKALIDIGLYLISNVAKEYSLNRLRKAFALGSVNTVSEYIQWLEDSYVLFSLPRFSWSAKSIAINPRKVYTIDTGFARANSLSFSKDSGRLFENAVYLQLRRNHKDLYYFRDKGECDFVVREGSSVSQVLQVCSEVNQDNMKREVDGLREAMRFFKLKEGLIITLDQEDELKADGEIVRLLPAWKWFSA